MNTQQQKNFINDLYDELFHKTLVDKVPDYCSKDFSKTNNYDTTDYEAFVAHIQTLSESSDKATFKLEYLVNVPGQVVLRAEVFIGKTAESNDPDALLISYWGIDSQGKVNSCIEVEYSSAD